MAKVIAGTYEILGKLGSGGGGVVYLGQHLRLEKKVVLKADKRKVTAKPDIFRREVDSLKNLSHQYIPQVYDFVVEDQIVYTIMDFIDGDSFNKPLKNGVKFSQPDVVKWACQLLEALSYLHHYPPHGIIHADIKPANIMLTPEGDIRLIDFNIALALGEDGAVAIGSSLGYASPEHLGLDYSSSGSTTRNTNINTNTNIKTTTLQDTSPETQFDSEDTPSATSGKRIFVDVRSDIYGLGATLYHILSGKRPDHKATDVVPLSDEEFSTAFVDVINKAMHPNPDMRYQTADEMLDAIKHLRENDPRVRALIRVRNMAAISLLFLFLAGSVTAFVGLRQGEAQQRLIAEQERVEAENQRAEAEKQRIEAENQRVEAENQRLEAEKQQREAELQEALALAAKSATSLQDGDRDNAVVHALSAFPTSENLSQVYVAEAQKSLSDALGVYDLADGFRPHKVVELPSETLQMAISEDGLTGAAVTIGELTIFSTETGTVIDTLETVNSALAELAFVGNDKLVYAGKDGITLYDTALKQTLWTGDLATEIAVSADGSTFASIYLEESFAKVYDASGAKIATIDLSGKKQRVTVNDSFANPNDNMLALNRDGSWLSASFNDGGLALFEISDPENRVDIFEESDFFHFEGGFSGDFFAFSSTGRESSVFAVIDMRYLEQTGGFEGNNPFGVSTSESGVYLSSENIVVKMDPITGEQEEIAFTTSNVVEFAQDGGNAIVSVDDKTFAFFDSAANQTDQYKNGFILDFVDTAKDYAIAASRSTPRIRISKRETHPSFFEYDTSYLHDEARLNASGTTVMLFSFEGFRLYDINGSIIKELEMPDSKQIYDQQYRRNDKGSYLEVIYNDGKTDMYSGDTGELIGTEQNDAPDLSLYEEFLTDNLKITSPLHGTPVAYSLETGEMIRELETDAYMTYVTQVGEYVITEYVSANSERFGLLLDGTTCETLAYMPNLSDILGERLIFDLGSSGMRETTLKSIPELVALAEGK